MNFPSGGGIAGLCLAVALSKHNHIQVSVYEAASRFKEIGAVSPPVSDHDSICNIVGYRA